MATPIVLNIISEAKEESDKRSIDMYGYAVENAIAKYQLTNNTSPTTIEELTVEYEGNKVNLIMDSNINKSGEAVKSSDILDKGLVSWISKEDYIIVGVTETKYGSLGNNNKGPITAMKYLELETSSWTKTGKIITSTFDDDKGTTHEMGKTISTKARMPKYSEVNGSGCKDGTSGSCPLWMINYLNPYTSGYSNKIEVSGVYGYWMLSSKNSKSIYAWFVNYNGSFIVNNVITLDYYGIRPVITLLI